MTEALLTQTTYEAVETKSENSEAQYQLSPTAVRVLDRFITDDVSMLEVSGEDAAQLAAGIMRLRGPRAGNETLDYPAILSALLAPDGTTGDISSFAMDGAPLPNVNNALKSLSNRCSKAAPKGITIEHLMQLGDPEYVPQITVKTAHELGGVVSVAILVEASRDEHGIVYQKSEDEYDSDEPLSWQVDALCAQTDPEAFFPDKGGTTRDAKRICTDCEVRDICLRYALQNDERFGIWGGLSERERRKLKTARKRNAA